MKCKNDEKKYYKGDEPSPKGRGYCASAEPVGTKKKGLDGKMWVVRKVKNGKRWFKVKSKEKKKTSPRMDGGDKILSVRDHFRESLMHKRYLPEQIQQFLNTLNDAELQQILDNMDRGLRLSASNSARAANWSDRDFAAYQYYLDKGDSSNTAANKVNNNWDPWPNRSRFDDY